MDMQTFAFVHCRSLVPISIWDCYAPCFTTQVGLKFGTTSSNMSRNINLNFYTLRGFAFKKENFLKFHGESNFHCLHR